MTSLAERSQIITLVQEAMDSGARQDRACTVINFNARTLQRWQVDQSLGDQRPCRAQTPTNKLSVRERKHVLAVANSDEFEPRSYGFRQGLGCKDALREVDQYLKAAHCWVVDVDLQSYFDTIPHTHLFSRK